MLRKLFATLLTLCLVATLFPLSTPTYAATANNTFAFGNAGSNMTITIPTLLGKTTVTIASKNGNGIWQTYEKEVLVASAPEAGKTLYSITDTTGKRSGDYMNFSGAYFPIGQGLHYDEASWSEEAKRIIGNGLIAKGQYMGDMMNFATKSTYVYPSYDKAFPYLYSLVTDLGNTIHGINGENLGSDILVVPSSMISNYSISPLPTTKPSNAVAASFTASTIYINGTAVAFDAYLINGNNYLKLWDVAFKLNGTQKSFDVAWDSAVNAIALKSNTTYTSVSGEMKKSLGATYALPTTSKILLNGNEIKLTAYNIGGNNYFKLRDLGSALNFSVEWDAASKSVLIDTGADYVGEIPAITEQTQTSGKIIADKNGNVTVGRLFEILLVGFYGYDIPKDSSKHWAANYIVSFNSMYGFFNPTSFDEAIELDVAATKYQLAIMSYVIHSSIHSTEANAYESTSDIKQNVFTDAVSTSSDKFRNEIVNYVVHFNLMQPDSATSFGTNNKLTEPYISGVLSKSY